MKQKNILVVMPHVDDLEISCSGYLQRMISKGYNVISRVLAIGGPCSNVPFVVRYEEYKKSMEILGISDYGLNPEFGSGLDGILSSVGYKLVNYLDRLYEEYKPEVVISCYRSAHQDHIFLYESYITSLRLKSGYTPKVAYLAEYPFIISGYDVPEGGKCYFPMSEETYNKKVESFLACESQVKPPPSPLGVEGLRVFSELRGMECGHKYAECMYQVKLVEEIY